MKALHRKGGIERSTEDAEMIRERCHIRALRVTRCDGLGIKIVGVHEIRVFRAEVIRKSYEIARGRYEIELRERIDALMFGFVMGKRQGAAGNLVQKVLESCHQIKPVAEQRAAGGRSEEHTS